MEPALVIACAVIFIIHRLNGSLKYNLPRLLLHGIQTFLPSSFGKLTAEQTATLSERDEVGQRLHELKLGPMITLNSGLVSVRYINAQPLYKVYDTFINVSICAVLSHLCLAVYVMLRGKTGAASSSKPYTLIDISSLMLLMSLVMSLQGQLQVVYLTGLGAREARYTVIIGFFAFAVALFTFKYQLRLTNHIMMLPAEDMLNSLAAHFSAILSIWSDRVPIYSLEGVKGAIIFCVAAIFGGLVTGIVIPAMRFSHIFCLLLISGNRNEKVRSLPLKAALVLDQMILPLAIIVTFVLPSFLPSLREDYKKGQFWIRIQLVSLVAAGLLRLALMKTYLQTFLNATIRTISMHVIDNNSTMAEIVRNKVEMRVNYLIPATLQYIAHPIFTLTLSLLAYDGLVSPAPADATELVRSGIVGKPYAQDALYRFLFYVGSGTSSPAVQFANLCHNIMTKLYIFPEGVFVQLALLLLCCYIAVWLLLHVVFTVYWSANSGWAQVVAGGLVTFRGQAFEGGKDATKEAAKKEE